MSSLTNCTDGIKTGRPSDIILISAVVHTAVFRRLHCLRLSSPPLLYCNSPKTKRKVNLIIVMTFESSTKLWRHIATVTNSTHDKPITARSCNVPSQFQQHEQRISIYSSELDKFIKKGILKYSWNSNDKNVTPLKSTWICLTEFVSKRGRFNISPPNQV